MTRLRDYTHKKYEPIQGTKVIVTLGGGVCNRTRAVEGEITRPAATMIYVRYQPHEKAPRPIEERFWKKDGSRVGDGKFTHGPSVRLAN